MYKINKMKNLLIVFLFLSNVVYGQSKEIYFKAYSTEMYILDKNNEWELYQKNGSTNITMVLEEDFLSILAQKPTVYRIFKTNTQPLKTENLAGTRYTAKELKSEEYCTVDVVRVRTSDLYIISVVNGKYNLRYFVNASEE